jgi:hypothetical protein
VEHFNEDLLKPIGIGGRKGTPQQEIILPKRLVALKRQYSIKGRSHRRDGFTCGGGGKGTTTFNRYTERRVSHELIKSKKLQHRNFLSASERNKVV